MRTALAALATALLLTGSVLAQQPPAPQAVPPPAAAAPGQAQAPGPATQPSAGDRLATDPAVQQSQDPQPSAQGTRAPKAGMTDTSRPQLQALLDQVWLSPVDLQGNPVTKTGATAATPSPAAATASGCGTTSHDLAAQPAGSPAPCEPAGNQPAAPAQP